MQEIAAGGNFFQMIEVEHGSSIVFVSFLTTTYDIQFGFYKVTPHSTVITEGDNDAVIHKHLEEIYPLNKLESSPSMVKVSFVAKEPGVYKVLWSNNHSWFKAKTLLYNVAVLRPVKEEFKVANDNTFTEKVEVKSNDLANIFNQSIHTITTSRR